MNWELKLVHVPTGKKPIKRQKIVWTDEMIATVIKEFPNSYNKQLSEKLRIGWRSLVRKARELGIEKEAGFLQKRRSEITAMAVKAHPDHWAERKKGWCVPNSEKSRFNSGTFSFLSKGLMV